MDSSNWLSIKDFADITGLSEATLRYYDKAGLLTPQYRGENRYRYYSPKQTLMVDFIKVFIKLGFPLSTITTLKKNRTPEHVLEVLVAQTNKLDARLRELHAAYSVMHTYLNNIRAGLRLHDNEISLQMLDEIPINMGEVASYSKKECIFEPFIQFCKQAHENKINLLYPVGSYYEDIHAFLDAPAQPTRLFSQDPNGHDRRKAGRYLVAYSKSYYGSYGDLPEKLLAYAKTRGLSFRGPLYITFLLDEISTDDQNQFLAEIVVAVSKNK